MKSGNIVPQSQPIHLPTSRLQNNAHINCCSQLLLSCKFCNRSAVQTIFGGTNSQTDGNMHNCTRSKHIPIGRNISTTLQFATLIQNGQHQKATA